MNVVYLSYEDISRSPMSGWVHFWAVANQLRDLGHTVTVIVPKYDAEFSPPDVPLRIMRLFAPAKNGFGIFCFEFSLLANSRRIKYQLRPEVLLVRGAGPGWMPGLVFWLFRALGVRVVLECNGIVWQEYAMRGKPRLLVADVVWSAWQQALACNQLIGVTAEIAEAHRRLARRDPSRVHVIPNGADVADWAITDAERAASRQEFDVAADAYVVGYVGMFASWHNVDQMIDAATQLQAQSVNDVVFLLIGAGTLFEWSLRQQQDRNLTNLRLPGPVTDRRALRRWMSCFDVGLVANRPADGSPLKVFEYLASGIPVIAAGFPQVTRLCRDHGVGIELQSGSSDEIVDAILQMRDNRSQWKERGRRNRQLAIDEYSWKRVGIQVDKVLRLASERT